jgi:oligopeptide/dipeptide ABC transporter ATP-binding protein
VNAVLSQRTQAYRATSPIAVHDAASPVLDVRGLTTVFDDARGQVEAVRNVDLRLVKGQVLALVGESGCGKTVTCLSILRLLRPPGRVTSGTVRFLGRDLSKLAPRDFRRLRGRHMAMILQNPMTSLNPAHTVGAQIAEVITTHLRLSRRETTERCVELLDLVGIPGPRQRLRSYPHQLSGGQRQRVMIALALALSPDLLIADEPTTALDLTIQAQILWLLATLQERVGMSMIYVTHDLALAANFADVIAVMYAGEVVEVAPAETLFTAPEHPYTRALQASMPEGHWRDGPIATIPGRPPVVRPGARGCSFADRCPMVMERCRETSPDLVATGGDHKVRCLLYA